jgi:hypothetical protein
MASIAGPGSPGVSGNVRRTGGHHGREDSDDGGNDDAKYYCFVTILFSLHLIFPPHIFLF